MKKTIISIFMVLTFVVLCFAGCGNGELTIYPKLSVENAKAGDTVTVEVYIDNAKRLCASDLYLSFDPTYVEYVSCEEQEVEDLYCVLGAKEDTVGNPYLMYSCYALETVNLDECLLFTATFTFSLVFSIFCCFAESLKVFFKPCTFKISSIFFSLSTFSTLFLCLLHLLIIIFFCKFVT